MIYNDFKGIKLSALGFGTMRLPTCPDGSINLPLVEKMTDYAIENGVNYFDTAYPYHGGYSETVIGEMLKKYDRESFFLATKYPGHVINTTYYPDDIFEKQLKKCQVDYFDFYLLHNVNEGSLPVYLDEKWGIVDYFCRQKELGRIRHLGISAHGRPDNMRTFLEKYADKIEFCQIQLNYLDWSLQEANEKYKMLEEYGIPVWVMEPVRGGKLASLPSSALTELSKLRDIPPAEWCFRFLQSLPNVKMILSGMSSFEQMAENIETFSSFKPTTEEENKALFSVAETLKAFVPCTGCGYCLSSCPKGLNIPLLMSTYNDVLFDAGITQGMFVRTIDKDKLPKECIGCGACAVACPQKINVPDIMRDFTDKMPTLPDWEKISAIRNEEAKRF